MSSINFGVINLTQIGMLNYNDAAGFKVSYSCTGKIERTAERQASVLVMLSNINTLLSNLHFVSEQFNVIRKKEMRGHVMSN